jgi:chromatin segregation and condensation protein Rec8/ScpA/Scc1 (kleisin family)
MEGWLEMRMAGVQGRVEGGALLALQSEPSRRAALFLAMLEMANSARVEMDQEDCFGPIWIRRVPRGEVAQPCHNVE